MFQTNSNVASTSTKHRARIHTDRSAGDAYSSVAPDLTFAFVSVVLRQSQHLGSFLRKYNLESNNITGCKNFIHNKHGAATRAILYLEAASP
jgi:hypothetical protein